MRNFSIFLFIAALLMLGACSGNNSPDPNPNNFNRMTATVKGVDGQPLPNLVVRVEGKSTGVTTNTEGAFELIANQFPNGVTVENELSFGKNGVILGTYKVVPDTDRTPVITFGDPNAGDPGSLSGTVFDELTGDPLSGVEVSLFSPDAGVLSTVSEDGSYAFETVPASTWNVVASKEGYHTEMASVLINEGADMVQHLALTPEGSVPVGDGLTVRGVLADADTGSPIAGATITMMADTGYWYGLEDGVREDINTLLEKEDIAESMPPADIGFGGPEMVSEMEPWMYQTTYQETTTNSDGSFEFPLEVVGYSIWMEFFADGYMSGNHYEYIEGRTDTLTLMLTMNPYVKTDIAGTVVDENDVPIEGAYVEFIYAGDWGEIKPGVAMPGVMELDDVVGESRESWDTFSAPPPPMVNGAGDSGNWDAVAPTAQQGTGSSGPNVDNTFLQRFRWENQNANRDASDIGDGFNGYVCMTTDETGKFKFEDIPAGDYYVFASAYRHISYDGIVELTAETGKEIEIELPNIPVGSVAGRVVDETGNPVPDCLVNATQPFVDPFTYTDSDGYYQIDNIPCGNWTISAYKMGYLTVGEMTEITEDATAKINLVIPEYIPPTPTLITYSGHIMDGSEGGKIVGADMVFTPVNNEYGGYYRHIVTGANGTFSTDLIPTEYMLLIQAEGYEDLYTRIWVDSEYPSIDLMLWPIASSGGPWGGGLEIMDGGRNIMPPIPLAE